MKIVQKSEEAKEAARFELESRLLSDPEIIETTVQNNGGQTTIYNRLPAQINQRRTVTSPSASDTDDFLIQKSTTGIAELLTHVATRKPLRNLTLSGEVDDDGISELWWREVDDRYRVFTNANCLYFSGAGSFEDGDYRYNPFLVINRRVKKSEDEDTWRPTLEDFTPGQIEYYVVTEPELLTAQADAESTTNKSAGTAEPSDEKRGFDDLEALLRYYASHTDDLRIAYENRLKIRAAREQYFAQKEQKAETNIINFRPLLASEKRTEMTAPGVGHRFTVTPGTAKNELYLQWSGLEAKYYFIEKSETLGRYDWEIAPFALKSVGAVEGAAIQSPAEKMFFRLVETDDQYAKYMRLDSDLDGISNGDELALGLDAFGGFIDTNNDSVLDEWTDIVYEGTLPADANLDGDLLGDRDEFLIGGNPANFDQQCDGNLDYIYRDDLLAYWNFDDHEGNTIKDVSGNGHDFTLPWQSRIYQHNRETFLRRKVDYQPSTNRYSDGEKIQTIASEQLADDFTIAFWARAYPYGAHELEFRFKEQIENHPITRRERFLVRKIYYDAVQNCFCLRYNHVGGNSRENIHLGSREELKGDRLWHHFAFSFRPAPDGADTDEASFSMYFDGELVHEANSIQPVPFTEPEFFFKYQGMDLDDIRLFKRGLSSAEVAQLRNGLQHFAARTDTEAPEAPSNGEWKTSAAGARANWAAVTDDGELNGYIVERDNRPTYFTKEPKLIDTVSGNHHYTVRAFDKALNTSAALELGSLANNTPPSGSIHLNLQGIDVPFHRMLLQKGAEAQIDFSGFSDDGDIFAVELQENGMNPDGAIVTYNSPIVTVKSDTTGEKTYDLVFTDDFGATTRSNEVTLELIDAPDVVYYDSDYPGISLLLSAETTAGDTHSVRLHWPENANPANYFISRKNPNETEWQFLGMLTGTPTECTDTTVASGTRYDYRVQRVYADTILHGKLHPVRLASGYVRASVEAPLVESRGSVLLLVDETVEAALRSEIDRFKQDLTGDGWAEVVEYTVPRHVDAYSSTTDNSPDPRYKERVQAVKTIIQDAYEERRGRLQAVILLGRVPIPLSGHGAADSHFRDHWGAWPADVYYGDVVQVEGDGEWTDLAHRDDKKPPNSNFNSPHPHNRNLPGDGKFDNGGTPSMVELAVGRIDLAEMSQLGKTEVELLRNYLDKNHAFRQGRLTAREKGLIDIDAVYPTYDREKKIFLEGDAGANAFNNFSALFGHENVEASNKDGADFFGSSVAALGGQSYLFGYGTGAGDFNRADQLFNGRTAATPARCRSNSASSPFAYTCDFADHDPQILFTALYGSYFGDWQLKNSLLRAPLGGETYGLACLWGYTGSGQDGWFFHGLGAGETLGDALLISQNNRSTYLSFGANPKSKEQPGDVVFSLMGDPTLRVFVCPPPTALTAAVEDDAVTLSWTASPADQRLGYHLYRQVDGLYQRVNEDLIEGTGYRESGLDAGTHAYQVRAVERRTTGSGSFINASQGVFVEAVVTNSADS